MSNMIKAYSVRYEEAAKKAIDTHLKLYKESTVKQALSFDNHVTGNTDDEFVEGIKAVVVEKLPSEEELHQQAREHLDHARAEAGQILEQARIDAQRIKDEAYAEAQKKGYEDGIRKGNQQADGIKAQLAQREKQLQTQYHEMVDELEPKIVELMADLIYKITGILIEDKEEVILYLVDRALNHTSKSDEYTIKVSKEDFEFLNTKQNVILASIGREVNLRISEDSNLMKNQCLIETDVRVIDCSLDIQLNNLITNLKLLCNI